ncbi:uncharacterized protein N7484_003982 [Penicillium longicatenatum]|uniref:uncharacterized protein n=1 Tax=Penicillium longicatenatum TaxID=1561947 RepID=UPI00254666C9|nr:uncharacterized protein N7484_003982 [Penicillium longicatenatum]KAJ5650259.1 hypothetical protein N7484_003982 [Penicillium longicatenatum]
MDIWSFAADYTGSHAILILYWYYYSDRSVDPEQQQEEEQEQEREENDNGQQNQSQHQDQSQEHGQRYRRLMSPSWRLKIVLGVCLDVVPLIPSIFFAINPRILSPGYYILIQCWSFGTVGLSTVLTLVYSLPQLYYTWKLGSVGSLSFLTMAIRIPTYFLVAASLAVRYGILDEITQPVGWFAGWNPCINLIIKGCQDGIILALCFYVRKTSATHETNPVLSEDTPLLSNIPDDDTT